MTAINPSNVLTCFYDIKYLPVSFGFVTFMVLADMHRRKLGCDLINVIIIPNQSSGMDVFGHLNEFTAEQATWRITNLLLPITGLFKTCHGVTVCPYRDYGKAIVDSCEGPIYPLEFNLNNSPNDSGSLLMAVLFANLGREIPSISPPLQAVEYANDWIKKHGQGKKIITITLREGTHNATMNSDIEVWSKFTKWIDTEIYFPVVLPDIEHASDVNRPEFTKVTFFSEAVYNIQLRAALYQSCYLNLIVTTGPEELMRYNPLVRYIKFKSIPPYEFDKKPSYSDRHGLPPDGQLPFLTPYQKIIPQEETFELIKTEFLLMVNKIEATSTQALNQNVLRFQGRVDSYHVIKIMRRYISGNQVFYALRFGELYMKSTPNDNKVRKFLLKFIVSQNVSGLLVLYTSSCFNKNQYDGTKGSFLKAHNSDPTEPMWMLGIALLELGCDNKDCATEWLENAYANSTTGTEIHALTLHCIGWAELISSQFENSIEYNKVTYNAQPHIRAKMHMVLIFELAGQYEEAIKRLYDLLKEVRNKNAIHRKLGQMLKHTGQLKKSIEHMMEAETL